MDEEEGSAHFSNLLYGTPDRSEKSSSSSSDSEDNVSIKKKKTKKVTFGDDDLDDDKEDADKPKLVKFSNSNNMTYYHQRYNSMQKTQTHIYSFEKTVRMDTTRSAMQDDRIELKPLSEEQMKIA